MSIQKQEMKVNGSGAARLGLATTLAAVALAFAPAVHAADAGMTVVKDPETGQLRPPTADEFKALEAQGLKAKAGKAEALKPAPVVERRSDGSKRVVLDESHMNYSVVTRNADGTLSEHCVTGPDAAQKVLSGKDSTAKNAKNAKENAHDHE